ncbi:MAG: tail fiber domain-containing protein [Bacteroidales bacterium]|nr:tail fiber domain-containing protein [Bacteroidales bacterium]MBN2821242.1 tail fiber domain-containing protein [Bacteroidales bacterium]
MKKILLFLNLAILSLQGVFSQSVGIADHEFSPHSSAALEIRSTAKGLLIPRMSFSEKMNIINPAEGLLIYQTDNAAGFYYFNGQSWENIGSSAVDNDADPTNEIQFLSRVGDTLFLSQGGYILLSAISDNLGNHSASQNIALNTYYLSADGDNEGLRITTSGNADFSGNLAVNGTANLENLNTNGTVNLGDDAIQSSEIEDAAVTNAKLADNAISTSKIQDAQITSAKLHPMGASVDQFLRYNGANWAPASISSGLTYMGTWDANQNNPFLSNAGGENGEYYIVSAAGTQNLGSGDITFEPGDWAIHNGTSWQKINNSNDVNSVFGRTGSIVAQYGDYTWGLIDKTNSSIDDITDVQASSPTSGSLLIGDGSSWSAQSISGDITLAETGIVQINNNAVEYSKLQDATGTANTILRWNGTDWEEVLISSIEGDASILNEIQDLSRTGNTLSLSGDATTVDLSSYLDNTDDQTLDLTGSILTIEDGNFVDLSTLSGVDTDDQTLSFSNDTLYIVDGNWVYLGAYLDNTDSQTLSINPTNRLTISDGNNVDLTPYLDNTDAQTLLLLDDTLYIANANKVFLGTYLDNTDNQDLSLTNDELSLTNDGTTVDLSGYLDNTDNQDLTLTDNTLSLSNDATPVDLSAYLDNTDAQQLSLSGTTLSLTNGGSVEITAAGDDLGDHTATENIQLSGHYLSNDGDDEGIFVSATGNVGIGHNLPTRPLHIISSANSPFRIECTSIAPDGLIQLRMNALVSPTIVNDYIQFLDGNNAKIGQIEPNGSTIAYTTTSDIRLKENLTPTSYGLEKLLEIKVYDFNFINSDKLETGFAAQELFSVFPGAVSIGGENPITDPWGVDYGKLTPLITKSVQELNAKVDSLEMQNQELEKTIEQLNTKLSEQEELEKRLEELEKIVQSLQNQN